MTCLHDSLHERLASLLLVLSLHLVSNAQLLKHGEQLLLVISHTGLDDDLDGLVHKLAEATLAALAVSLLLGPLLGLGVEEIVTPQLLHHLGLVSAELLGVNLGEGGQSEGPAVKTSAERDSSLLGVHLHRSEEVLSEHVS